MAGPGSGTGFQTFVNAQLPPGIPGDYAGANIRSNYVAGPGAAVASPAGVGVGLAAFFNPATGYATNYFQPNSFCGFVHRSQQALITNFLGISSVGIVGGDMVTLMAEGDFWGLFTAGGTAGQIVYANPTTGALSAAATGQGVTVTDTQATIASNVLTAAGTVTGTIAVGQIVAGTGIPAGTYVASFGTGTGGTGTYNLANLDGTTIPNIGTSVAVTFYGIQPTPYVLMQPVAADASVTAAIAVPATGDAYSVMTVSAVASGTLVVGQYLSGTGLAGSQNVQIYQQLSGTAGSTGTYNVTPVQTAVASTTITATQGKVGKISSWGGAL